MNIAFVYDWFDTEIGGAERLIKTLHHAFPDAPWYTSHIDHDAVPWAHTIDVRSSFLQRLPRWFRRNRILTLLLTPFAFESFDLGHYDVVVSVSSGFAKNVITRTGTKHICILLTPPRWLWSAEHKGLYATGLAQFFIQYLRKWDMIAAQRVDVFLAISKEVARRCHAYYEQSAEVLYPPFDYDYWHTMALDEHKRRVNLQEASKIFIIVSRLEPYKRIDLAIRAFGLYHQLKKGSDRLIIVGSGSQEKYLAHLVHSLGLQNAVAWKERVSDEALAALYATSTVLIMPQEEDFGYTACEAIACGCPVIVYAKGGQTEIVTMNATGMSFDEPTPEALCAALVKMDTFEYNQESYENSHIRGWSRNTFVATLSQKITQTV